MNAIVSYITHSLFLLTLGAALGSILLAGFVKSCSYFGLLPVRDQDGEWHRFLRNFD
jgi:hypothetical protein